MKKSTLFGFCALSAFTFIGCQSDDSPSDNTNPDAYYEIINNGSAGVNSVTDNEDSEALLIVQAIPSVSGQQYPANAPILFFFNDKLLLSSINENSFIVTQNDSQVSGIISVNQASNGYAIVTFTPENKFAVNATIKVKLTTALQDDGGQGLEEDVEYQYTTFSEPTDDFEGNGGFENGNDGVVFLGDGNVLSASMGCMSPFAGSSFGAITTGSQLVSNGEAIGGASSIMVLGPFNSDVSSLSFNYNFLSAEFLEYVDSEYDDSFMAVVYGQNGAHSEFVTSVNIIGTNNTQCDGFPGMPDAGDGYAGSTGWLNKQINFGSITGPVYVIFIATDVEDQIYSTVVGIDNVTVD